MKTLTILLLATVLLRSCTCLEDDANLRFADNEEELHEGAQTGQVDEHFSEKDQEEFVGGKSARRKLAEMSEEDAHHELRRLVVRVDLNGDTLLDRNELVDWLRRIEDNHFSVDADEQWKKADQNLDGFVTILEWTQREVLDKDVVVKMENVHSSQKRKFAHADSNGDEKLTREEFSAMLHPDRHAHMLDHLVEEYMRGFDKDKDGYITLKEYMAIYSRNTNVDDLSKELEDEKREFEENLDKDSDGRLDREEVKRWAVPSLPGDVEYFEDEADHLIHVADKNEDGFLSAEEIEAEFQQFIDSPLTDFGHTVHDEL